MAIHFRLKSLIEEKEFVTGQRITYRDIADASGVSTNTLTQMANQRMQQIGIVTIDKLCRYFTCTPGELMVYIPQGPDFSVVTTDD